MKKPRGIAFPTEGLTSAKALKWNMLDLFEEQQGCCGWNAMQEREEERIQDLKAVLKTLHFVLVRQEIWKILSIGDMIWLLFKKM